MRIEGVDITSLVSPNIEFLEYSPPAPSFSSLVTTSDGDRKIVNRRKTIGIVNMQVRVAIHDTKENAQIIASKLVSFLGEAYVDFYGDLIYRVTMASEGQLNLLTDYLHEYTFQLQVLEKFGQGVEINTTSASPIVLTNDGSYKTPIIIEVTPTTSIASFSVYGFGAHTSARPLIFTSPTLNKKTIIDGVECRIMQEVVGGYNDRFASTNLISFPEIPVGGATLTFSPTNLNIKISYNPRYI